MFRRKDNGSEKMGMVIRFLYVAFPLMFTSCLPLRIFDGKIGKNIYREIKIKGKKEIDLAAILPFEWDLLYMFEPYTSSKSICETMKMNEQSCKSEIKIESSDDGTIPIFAELHGKIVYQEKYERYNGDFTPINYPQPIRRSQAKFKVVSKRDSTQNWEWIKLIPTNKQ